MYQQNTIAIEDYSKAIEIKPSDASIYDNRGVSKANLKDYSGAIRDYNKAIELDPNDGGAYHNRGISKYYSGDLIGACEDAKESASLLGDDDSQLVKVVCN